MTEQKRMYKVLAAIPKRDGGSWFMRVGSAFRNKDDSINAYLDVIPFGATGPGKSITLQIRELDESDLRQRESHRANGASGATSGSSAISVPAGSSSPASTGLPF